MANRRTVQRRRDGEPPQEAPIWALRNWQRHWGRPPQIVLMGLWAFYGPLAFFCFAGAATLLLSALRDAPHEPAAGPIAVVVGGGLAALGYFFAWRPIWRTQCYYWSFDDPGGSNMDEPMADGARSDAQPPPPPAVKFLPHSAQYKEAVEKCRLSIAERYAILRVPDKELPRHQKFLALAVQPSTSEELMLLDAFEVTSPPFSLTYGIVAYQNRNPDVRPVSGWTRCGQIVMVVLDCDLGRLWIRPETLSDKLAEWVVDKDLDFAEHPQFSRRYLCRSDHPDRVTLQVPQRVWESIGKRDDLLILSHGSHLILGKAEYLKPEDALDLVDLAVEILDAFGAESQLRSPANPHWDHTAGNTGP